MWEQKLLASRCGIPDAALSERPAVLRHTPIDMLLLLLTWSEAEKVVIPDHYAV